MQRNVMEKLKSIKGIITALASPFKEGKWDALSFNQLLESQKAQGIDALVINGTTGESPCLSTEEVRDKAFEPAKKFFPNLPLILGVGGNHTAQVLKNIHQAKDMGADAVLAVVPYYNKPPQRGLVKHFSFLAEKGDRPIILYNVPARTGVGLSLESVLELSQKENIIGIKEATGDIDFGKKIIKNTDDSFIVLSGDDETALELCAEGAKGVVSVVSHIIGDKMKQSLQKIKAEPSLEKKKKIAEEFKTKHQSLLKSVYQESNPIGIKAALNLMGVFQSAELRSPLVALQDSGLEHLKQQLKKVGLL